ncbi:MAG TPA: tetratricopeptide repeat protein [Mycobacteriales bacterium]
MAGSRRPGPAVEPPEDVDPRDLAPEIRSQLRTLSKLTADRVARHLVAAGRLVDEDPEAALQHARAARALGARVAVVREAAGETAYAAGEWAEAIAELRTARRMTGDGSTLPLIADAERALGRPERALRLTQSAEAQALPPAARAEMRIVEAGVRRDLGQLDAALVTLAESGLDPRDVRPWSARLWYAYADTLLALGRIDEARDWFLAAASVDEDGTTDADERVLELEGVEIVIEGDDGDELDDDLPATATPPPDDTAATPADGSADDVAPEEDRPAAITPAGPTAGGGGAAAFTDGRTEEREDRPAPPAVDQLFSDVPGDTAR